MRIEGFLDIAGRDVAFALQHVRQLRFGHDTYLGPQARFSTLIECSDNIIAKPADWRISEVTGYPKHLETSIRSGAFAKAGTLAAHPNLPVTSSGTVSRGQGMVHEPRFIFATHAADCSGRRFRIVVARQC